LDPTLDHMVGRVHCPTWSLDRFLLQGLPSETRWLPGQRSVGGARPELVRYHLFFRPMGRASGVGARCWGTLVEIGCLLTYRQLISGCRAVRNLSPTGALFLFHDVRLYDPEWRIVRGQGGNVPHHRQTLKHFQMFSFAREKMRLTGWKKLFPTSHIKQMQGNFEQNEKYCSKEGTLVEHGVRPRPGQRNDLETLKAGRKAHGHCV